MQTYIFSPPIYDGLNINLYFPSRFRPFDLDSYLEESPSCAKHTGRAREKNAQSLACRELYADILKQCRTKTGCE